MNCKILSLSLIAAALCAQGACAATANFKVNGQTVTKAEQDEVIKALVARGQKQTPELEEAVKNQLIRQTVLLQEAKKAKVERRTDVKKAIKAATDNILANAFVADYAKNHPVSDADAKKVFEENKKRWGSTEVSVRHILVKDKVTAERLLGQVKGGADFAKLAEANSIDTQQNRGQGGLIEWTSPNMFDKAFADGFANLKAGEVNPKVVETRLGWHVVKLEGKRAAQNWQDYNAYAPQLKNALLQQRTNQYLEELFKKAKVTK